MPQFEYTCCKEYKGYSCAHRQWSHPGHCKFVHGYSRSFKFWFKGKALDQFGFVVDFSSLQLLEQKLQHQFDHTFLINKDDPLLKEWERLNEMNAIDLRIMENVGMESSAQMIWEWANSLLLEKELGRVCCWKAESRENESNSACYEFVPNWFINTNKNQQGSIKSSTTK